MSCSGAYVKDAGQLLDLRLSAEDLLIEVQKKMLRKHFDDLEKSGILSRSIKPAFSLWTVIPSSGLACQIGFSLSLPPPQERRSATRH